MYKKGKAAQRALYLGSNHSLKWVQVYFVLVMYYPDYYYWQVKAHVRLCERL